MLSARGHKSIQAKPARLAALGIKASFSALVGTVFRDLWNVTGGKRCPRTVRLSSARPAALGIKASFPALVGSVSHYPLANLGNVFQTANKITHFFADSS